MFARQQCTGTTCNDAPRNVSMYQTILYPALTMGAYFVTGEHRPNVHLGHASNASTELWH